MFEGFEVRWSAGGRTHVLVVDEEGTPHLEDAAQPRARPPKATPPRRGAAWTAEEEAKLRDALHGVDDASALAEELGRSRGAVIARAVRLGLVPEAEAGLRYPPARADG